MLVPFKAKENVGMFPVESKPMYVLIKGHIQLNKRPVLTDRWSVVSGHANLGTAVVTAFTVSTAVNIEIALL